MSIQRCRVRGCPHYTRTGYGDNPHMKADGVFCWRCRQRHAREEAKSLRDLARAEKKAK